MKLTYNRTSGKTSQRRERITFTREQLDELENVFSVTRYPDVQVRVRLAIKLGLTGDKILIWFKNRRAKTKNTYCNDVSENALNSPRADSRTMDTDDVRKLTPNGRLAKKRTPDDDDVNTIMPNQLNKRLRCVDVEVSDGLAWMPKRTSTPVSCKTEYWDSSSTLSASETYDVSLTEHYLNNANINKQSITSSGNNRIYNNFSLETRSVGDALISSQHSSNSNLTSDVMPNMTYFGNTEYFVKYNHGCISSAADSWIMSSSNVEMNAEMIVPTPYTKVLTYVEL